MALNSVSVHDCKTGAANSLFCPWCLESFNLPSGLWRFDSVEKGWRKGWWWYYQVYSALRCSAWKFQSLISHRYVEFEVTSSIFESSGVLHRQPFNPILFTKFIRLFKRSWKSASNLKTGFEFQFQYVKDFLQYFQHWNKCILGFLSILCESFP